MNEPFVAALDAVREQLAATGHDDWARWCTTLLALARRNDARAASRYFAAFDGEGDLGTLAQADGELAARLAVAHDAAVAFDRAARPS
ncbi:MAG: hypothetical protein ACKO91_03930 [Acidimicrobiales bacterium]